jgi:EAL domain-containing protein (putative c-di-GMP-specific phosphodiesterase class I)
LHETGLDPGSLDIEFTESVAMQDPERSALILNKLRALEALVRVSITSRPDIHLWVILGLSLDILKLDRSLVSAVENNNESRKITPAIIGLAHNLVMDVVAEGIETIEQANEFRSLVCKYAQRYFSSNPMAQDCVGALLKSGGRGADFSFHMRNVFKSKSLRGRVVSTGTGS